MRVAKVPTRFAQSLHHSVRSQWITFRSLTADAVPFHQRSYHPKASMSRRKQHGIPADARGGQKKKPRRCPRPTTGVLVHPLQTMRQTELEDNTRTFTRTCR